MLQYNLFTLGESQVLTVIVPGDPNSPYACQDDHPNFKAIVAGVMEGDESVTELFDIAAAVSSRFERLSERVAVKNGEILFDGDPVDGSLQQQIIEFLNADEDFEPLVLFYEKLATNPLGDVREGLYDWIAGQRQEGNFTITPEGDILGYKAVRRQSPEWRTDVDEVFVPSRRGEGVVNGRDVTVGEYIEQVPGDIVEMPRSRVLHSPSRECGDGLHIGTYSYAKGFMSGNGTVMLVKFSPRDIVSLPDNNASWKLRVCRYEVVQAVDAPLQVPVWSPGIENPTVEFSSGDEVEPDEDTPDVDLSLGDSYSVRLSFSSRPVRDTITVGEDEDVEVGVGDRVSDPDGDEGVVEAIDHVSDEVTIRYDYRGYGTMDWSSDEVTAL
jgi:hypothetical protein